MPDSNIHKPKVGDYYRHYKSTGGRNHVYKVIGFGRHTETGEVLIVYKPLYINDWLEEFQTEFAARPLAMFMEMVEIDGIKKPRFQLISESEIEG